MKYKRRQERRLARVHDYVRMLESFRQVGKSILGFRCPGSNKK